MHVYFSSRMPRVKIAYIKPGTNIYMLQRRTTFKNFKRRIGGNQYSTIDNRFAKLVCIENEYLR